MGTLSNYCRLKCEAKQILTSDWWWFELNLQFYIENRIFQSTRGFWQPRSIFEKVNWKNSSEDLKKINHKWTNVISIKTIKKCLFTIQEKICSTYIIWKGDRFDWCRAINPKKNYYPGNEYESELFFHWSVFFSSSTLTDVFVVIFFRLFSVWLADLLGYFYAHSIAELQRIDLQK